MKQILCFLYILLFILPGNDLFAAPAVDNLFLKANRFYLDGNFKEAVSAYKAILQKIDYNSIISPGSSGEVFYNMGNCYHRLGENGRAILNYERASRLLPRDSDLNYNLEYLKETVKDKIESNGNSIFGIFFWIKSFSGKELFTVFSAVSFFFFFLLILRLYYKTEFIFYMLIISFIIYLISGISFGIKSYQLKFDSRAVVLDTSASVLAGPDTGDTLLFKIHEGTILFFERKEQNFSLIRFQDGRRGWLLSSSIASINPGKYNKT